LFHRSGNSVIFAELKVSLTSGVVGCAAEYVLKQFIEKRDLPFFLMWYQSRAHFVFFCVKLLTKQQYL